MKVKLGAAYNVWDGIELLEKSIRLIRKHVDYVCVVFQEKSNYGNKLSESQEKVFLKLLDEKLINMVLYYDPIPGVKASVNEVEKRNIGKRQCEVVGCTHFLTIDADEYYAPSRFEEAKRKVIDGNFDASACQMITYYKDTHTILWPPEQYFVPFIYKLDDREFREYIKWPVLADPTRKLESKNVLIFDREEIQMHHLSYVRNDIRQKLYNSSALPNFRSRVEQIANYYDHWHYPQVAYLAGSKEKYFKVKMLP